MFPVGRALTIATMAALIAVTPAAGVRRPTDTEARAIRAAALKTLHGSGWKVSHIRVSTVRNTKHRYASAAVDNTRTGVGGAMILRRDSGIWKRIFLGTDSFCDSSAPHSVLRDLGFGSC